MIYYIFLPWDSEMEERVRDLKISQHRSHNTALHSQMNAHETSICPNNHGDHLVQCPPFANQGHRGPGKMTIKFQNSCEIPGIIWITREIFSLCGNTLIQWMAPSLQYVNRQSQPNIEKVKYKRMKVSPSSNHPMYPNFHNQTPINRIWHLLVLFSPLNSSSESPPTLSALVQLLRDPL